MEKPLKGAGRLSLPGVCVGSEDFELGTGDGQALWWEDKVGRAMGSLSSLSWLWDNLACASPCGDLGLWARVFCVSGVEEIDGIDSLWAITFPPFPLPNSKTNE